MAEYILPLLNTRLQLLRLLIIEQNAILANRTNYD